jgi:hypothetical protein
MLSCIRPFAEYSSITLIVGRGNHSEGGIGVIGWRVREYLTAENIPFTELAQGGALLIGMEAFL